VMKIVTAIREVQNVATVMTVRSVPLHSADENFIYFELVKQ
jgi:hypothetical protein